jgi:hypothetical protein
MDYVAPDGRDRVIPRFYVKPIRMNFQSEKEGREVWEDHEYVEIIVPGDSKNIVHEAVKEHHRERWPTQYQRFKSHMEAPSEGTPLEEWAAVGASMVMELKSHHVRTVEHLAGLSDSQLSKVCPMGGHALRERAKRFLEQVDAEKPIAELTQQVEALKAEIAAMREKEAAS